MAGIDLFDPLSPALSRREGVVKAWPGAPPSRRQASPRRRSRDIALPSRLPVPAEAGKMPALPGSLG